MPPRSRRLRQRQRDAEQPDAASEPVEAAIDAEEAPVADEYAAEAYAAEEGLDVDLDGDLGDEPMDEAPSSRGRGASRPGRSSRRRRGATADDAAAPTEDGGRSGRRSGKRSAREPKVKAKKPKKVLSPAEQAARKRLIKGLVIWVLVLGILGGGGYAAWEYLRPKPQPPIEVPLVHEEGRVITIEGTKYEQAKKLLIYAQRYNAEIDKYLSSRQPDSATRLQTDAKNMLLHDVLAHGGNAAPSPEDEAIGSVEQAKAAYDLMLEIVDKDAAIKQCREDLKAQANTELLQNRLAHVDDEPDLDALEKACQEFMSNPVNPGSGLAINADRYQGHLKSIQNMMDRITSERNRRLRQATSEVVIEVNAASQNLIDEMKFGEALRYVDQKATEHQKADLSDVRKKVLEGARIVWETSHGNAKQLYATAISATTDPASRAGALDKAIKELERVADNFGGDVPEMADYVRQAQDLLTKYRATRF